VGEPRTAAIVYRSRTGTTRRFAEEIGAFLAARGLEARVVSIGECDVDALRDVDVVLLGCWTEGLFIVRQHPDRPWVSFARRLPALTVPRVGLFATYKLATGSMFAKMREALVGTGAVVRLELKSRDGTLSDAQRQALERFLGSR
jgi:flavodoxin